MSGWTAILPLIGVAIGALLQHWLSRNAEARKQLELLRSQAYVDYLRAVAKAAHASSSDAQRSALADAADAKARIAVYGSARVVQALAAFEQAGPTLDNPRSIACFLAVVSAMRIQAGAASTDDLKAMLIAPTALRQ
jgi:hypothetical protein